MSLFCYCCVVYLCFCGELSLCGGSSSGFSRTNANYSRYCEFLYLCKTTQAYPYGCVQRGHVEGEVIKPGLEWNLELLF